MTGIFIAAKKDDKKMQKLLPGILRRNLGAVSHMDGPIALPDPRPAMVVGNLIHGAGLHPDEAVIIFKEIESIPCRFPAGENAVGVVDSAGDSGMLEAVSATMLPAITCGLSPRDTLTLSSIGRDSAVVTLQRSVACFDGSVAEPQEIPIALSAPIENFTLMAAAAVFILTGKIERLKTADFSQPDEKNYHS